MAVRSSGNSRASFRDRFLGTGNRASRPGGQGFSASGGNVDGLAPGNGYKYHTFTSSGTFIVSGTASIEVLVVAGGGGGAGGGGAGGAGSNGTSSGGAGGVGVQLPATFRNPVSAPGPISGGLGTPGPSGSYWVAGGGGGSGNSGGPASGGAGGGGTSGSAGIQNTGGGGGGNIGATLGLSGGSGIVLIAYPS